MSAYLKTCGARWANHDAPKYRGPHVCRLKPGHDGGHACACGAVAVREKAPR